MRILAITQNIALDGSIELLGDWFDPQGQAGADNSDLLEELHRKALSERGRLLPLSLLLTAFFLVESGVRVRSIPIRSGFVSVL